jgi:ComF family protein
LAKAVDEKLKVEPPDMVIPVPLHLSKLRERTYNQSLLLARTLGKTLKLPVVAEGLERTRATLSQQGLKSEERKRNLKGAFYLRQEVKNQRVLLLDDVLTTGTTARECSRILIRGGASDVQVAVLARAAKFF